MEGKKVKLKNWGGYPCLPAVLYQPANTDECVDLVRRLNSWIARGMGRCYGDAALGENVISTHLMRGIIEFDREKGEITCLGGTTLAEILEVIVPAGRFFYVTPGIKSISVGGAIASDVHGKNHSAAGCFSNHLIEFSLLLPSGNICRCSRTENADLFWNTCGGMGWTGLILEARFRLMPLKSTLMRQTTVKAPDLQTLFDAFEGQSEPYAAAWIDVTHHKNRGIAFFADHYDEGKAWNSQPYSTRNTLKVPIQPPFSLLNRFSIGLYNRRYYQKNTAGERLIPMDDYFYPLDRIEGWNKLYGPRGFIQYQFCLPENTAHSGITEVLAAAKKAGQTPFLTVLKRHGNRPETARHSFPIKGWSLALDFPRRAGIFELVTHLDEIVWDKGGKVYLTKDACSHGRMGRVDPGTFGYDACRSALKTRILHDLASEGR